MRISRSFGAGLFLCGACGEAEPRPGQAEPTVVEVQAPLPEAAKPVPVVIDAAMLTIPGLRIEHPLWLPRAHDFRPAGFAGGVLAHNY